MPLRYRGAAQGLEKAEEKAGPAGGDRAPFREDQCGQRDRAAPDGHVAPEPGPRRGGHVSAGKAARDAGDHQRRITQQYDRDARGIDGRRVFALRAQAEPVKGAIHEPSGQRQDGEGEIDEIGKSQYAPALAEDTSRAGKEGQARGSG